MKVSAEQIDRIKAVLSKGNITLANLHDDLLDHLCCVVEYEMEKGKTFSEALSESLEELAPKGLAAIQNETLLLIHEKKIIRMKKLTYLIGMLTAMSFGLGWTFGIMHWPGTRELSIFGLIGFVILFLPLLAIDHFRNKPPLPRFDKLKFAAGIGSGVLVASSLILKILHLPGADQLLLVGAGLFVFGFLPFLFFSLYKKSSSQSVL